MIAKLYFRPEIVYINTRLQMSILAVDPVSRFLVSSSSLTYRGGSLSGSRAAASAFVIDGGELNRVLLRRNIRKRA